MLKKLIFLSLFILLALLAGAQENYYLNKIKIKGNHHISSARIFDQISMKQNRRLLFWKKKYHFHESELDLDLQNVKEFYQKQGFLLVQIEPEFNIDEEEQSVKLTLHIQENEPVLVSRIAYEIQAADSVKLAVTELLPSLQKKIKLKPENRFQDSDLLQSQKILLEKMQDAGYPFSEVDYQLELNEKQDSVLVKFHISPDEKMYYAELRIEGNEKVKSELIRQQVSFPLGKQFHPKDLRKTQRQIQDLNMFQYAALRVEHNPAAVDAITVLINVKEAPRLTSRLSVGYGLEERLRAELNLTKLGFLGGIRKAVFIARHNYLEPYKVSLEVTQPALFHPNASFSLNPFILKKNEKGYNKESVSVYGIYRIKLAIHSAFHLDYDYEWNDLTAKSDFIEDQLQEEGKISYQLSSFSLGYNFNNGEPVLSPEKGWYFGSSLILTGLGFYSDYHYYKFRSELRKYFSLGSQTVFATRWGYGVMKPLLGDEVTPLAERFYGGGKNSVRGWKYSELGPLNEEGVPSGGNSLLEASVELRFPLYKILSGVVFLDGGNVWKKEYEHDLNDLRFAVGSGLRFKTQLGSLRIDAAFPLDEKDLPVQFYLSIGEAF